MSLIPLTNENEIPTLKNILHALDNFSLEGTVDWCWRNIVSIADNAAARHHYMHGTLVNVYD